ncbi:MULTISPECIES: lipopolysaccharide assembly protein LapA domain-containing protein [unclassified Streptomyces]|uniref:lipopolysaccharide assembly protein LapA domain-containing protein n=1 Tax=unclassified Streptomyces TaxID=2593676 RepID=UPI0004C87043|nr:MULTISPECIES: LapA family protein [unclassified Streptomyces]WSF83528.1 LapA family protein [Streptomyces sp. NBC_01744]WSC40187.1 LapA family protein [Streptomyces sp. NBC_01763]WSC48355.1 LapA family protein [Streptomyces sp. NBC_01762]WSC52684.1 LapA family protein [Streptomyces sp. NBC_01761]WSD28007.1 LapA family protein [Streptomyces sp. NBC_01751]
MSPKDVSSGGKGAVGAFSPSRIVVLVIAILSLVFIVENTDEVTIRLLIPLVTMPLAAVLLAMFVAGLVCGGYLFRRRAK